MPACADAQRSGTAVAAARGLRRAGMFSLPNAPRRIRDTAVSVECDVAERELSARRDRPNSAFVSVRPKLRKTPMNLLKRFKNWREARKPRPIDQWFFVEFDDAKVVMRASPAGKPSWEQSFPWSSVTRVCFKDEGPWSSDGIYVFTSLRPESFVIPTEANGGEAFLQTLTAKGLFPEEVAGRAFTSSNGGLYCWPPERAQGDAGA
jgi:hypothetical protein